MPWWPVNGDDRNRRRDDVSTAEIVRTLDRHMEDCVKVKDDIHQKLDEQEEHADQKHAENLARFAKIDRTIYIATGVALAIGWAMTHGGEVVAKILK
jgi:hypothetical protein